MHIFGKFETLCYAGRAGRRRAYSGISYCAWAWALEYRRSLQGPRNLLELTPMTILCGRGAVTAAHFPNLHTMEASSCVFEIVIGCYQYHCFLKTLETDSLYTTRALRLSETGFDHSRSRMYWKYVQGGYYFARLQHYLVVPNTAWN
jgi:hypothetical protein